MRSLFFLLFFLLLFLSFFLFGSYPQPRNTRHVSLLLLHRQPVVHRAMDEFPASALALRPSETI